MEKLNQIYEYVINKNLFVKKVSISEGDFLHAVYILLKSPEVGDIRCDNIKEIYHRISIKSTAPLEYLFVDFHNDKLKMIKRRYIATEERILDPLVPKFREDMLEGRFSVTQLGNFTVHLPLLLLPGDKVYIKALAKRPFEAELKVEW